MSRPAPPAARGPTGAVVAALSVAALLGALAVGASAGSRGFWRFETASDFLSGESTGVSVGPEGRIRLAPALRVIHESAEPFTWAVLGDDAGGAFAGGGGSAGTMVHAPAGGEARLLADTGEAAVHAAARAPDGTLYFGTSPNGRVYRAAPGGGERTVFFEPEARYVWAIAVEPAGTVLVATGGPGAVHRVAASGASETLFETREDNVTALHRSDDGVIHLGTEPSGIVFRIGADGDAIALYDSPLAEIRGLAANSQGEVFAAAVAAEVDDGAPPPLDAGPPPLLSGGGASVSTSTQIAAIAAAARASFPGRGDFGRGDADGTQGAVYRIAANGAAETIWESAGDRPLSLALLRDERLLVGTGDRGVVYRISRDGDLALLTRADAGQISAAWSEGGRTLLGTSNPGLVLAMGPSHATEGTHVSRVLDAGSAASWGRLSWEARIRPGTALAVETRSGNSGQPDDTWSDWAAAEDGAQAPSPPARFLQWRATLRSDGGETPELTRLEVAWLQANLAPRVASITMHPPGVAFEQVLNPSSAPIQGMAEPLPTTSAAREGAPGIQLPGGSGRRVHRHGVRTATFEAEDPNGDQLTYRVSYRLIGETSWRELRSGLVEPVVAWDTSNLPDGRYEIRVEALDDPDNPPDAALAGSRVSRPFTVDNTPPEIGGLAVGPDGAIRFTATDAVSPIRRAQIAVDAGPLRVVRPVDGIADSLAETFEAAAPEIPGGGGGTLVVRVEDELGNWSTAETPIGR